MKTWIEAGLSELNIQETAMKLYGLHNDGGYVGDGHLGQLDGSFDLGCGGSGNGGNTDNGGDNGSTPDGGVDSLS